MLRSVMSVLVALMVTGGSVYAEERSGSPGAEQRQAPTAERGHGGEGHRHALRRECRECMLHGGNDEESCRHCWEAHSRGHGGGGPGREQWHGMMQMRQQMLEQMKKQDAELARLVDQMNSASPDRKQALMAEILTRMVQQRADFYQRLERMHRHMGPHYREGHPMEDDEGGDTDTEDSDDGYRL